jgi:glycosyltransferase involved in cell wall biosynthesis
LKKVLIVARYFGTRIPGLMKYLPEYGWQPVLLAPASPPGEPFPPGSQIVTTPYNDPLHFWKRLFGLKPGNDLRSGIKEKLGFGSTNRLLDFLLTYAGAIISYPDNDKGWRSFAIKAGNNLLKEDKYDAIISSSSPVTAHIIAVSLKKNSALPWLADLRDPWSQNHNYSYGRIRKWFDKRLELKTLGAADALVTVSQPWADNLKTLHSGKTTYTVTNGFDPAMLNDPAVPLTEKMTITYTGLIYQGKQNPVKLFEALRALINEKVIAPEKVEVRFYGITGGWLNQEIEKHHLQNIVKKYGNVNRQESIDRQRDSHILLLLNWDDPKEKGTIPGKVFEYMAARRPILATGGGKDDAIQQILSDSKAGYYTNSTVEIKAWLRERYKVYLSSGTTAPPGNDKAIMLYSQREMARKFAEILEQILAR